MSVNVKIQTTSMTNVNYLTWDQEDILDLMRKEFPELINTVNNSNHLSDFLNQLKDAADELTTSENEFQRIAATRIIATIHAEGNTFLDNSTDQLIEISTLNGLYTALKLNHIEGERDYFLDLYFLFKQFYLTQEKSYDLSQLKQDMDRWHTGMEESIIEIREKRKEYLIDLLIEDITQKSRQTSRYRFLPYEKYDSRKAKVLEWWEDYRFHLTMAARSSRQLNRFMEDTLGEEQLTILQEGEKKGIPIFVTPYYASLLDTSGTFNDRTIRNYIIYTRNLVDQFGKIKAWEKEDLIEHGRPNAAGWILPESHNIHRRYPEVAIVIPDSMGRACGGLCSLCQRMYNFQKGVLNFDLDKLKPKEKFKEKFSLLMDYFEKDSQLRDVLITGGDALMSQTSTLQTILNDVLDMAIRKKEANIHRADGEKYAEIQRIRLGSRLLAYLPQRITPKLIELLADVKKRGKEIGITQFVIQTHFESPLEVTPEAKKAAEAIQKAGWVIDNQLVFTAQASRRGHTAKLRSVLNSIGIVTYYTFTVKGFEENRPLYAPNSRSVQEMKEEKAFGILQEESLKEFLRSSRDGIDSGNISQILIKYNMPFIATDRSVLNLPGVGKSMTFETIGVTRKGERILRFSHDSTRKHSPVIEEMPEMIITENRSIGSYLQQMCDTGEELSDYDSIWYYSIGNTEPRFDLYRYPKFPFGITKKITHIRNR